jgi:hypothetical protein
MFSMTAFHGHSDDFLYEFQREDPPPQYSRPPYPWFVLKPQDAKIIKRARIRVHYDRLRSLARRLRRFILK